MPTIFDYKKADEKFSFEIKVHEFGHAEYSTTKSKYADFKELAKELKISSRDQIITTIDSKVRELVVKSGMKSKIMEMVLHNDITTFGEVEYAVHEQHSDIYKVLHDPIAKCKKMVTALLKDKDSELKLTIAFQGAGLLTYTTFKKWIQRLRNSIEDSPAMVEMLDRAISHAMNADRGDNIKVVWPYEADDFNLMNLETLEKLSSKLMKSEKKDKSAKKTSLKTFKLSQDHIAGFEACHKWLDHQLGIIIQWCIDGDILQQITTGYTNIKSGGFCMLTELFLKYGKFDARELKDIENKLNNFTFAKVENSTNPQVAPNGINDFNKLYSLLLGQKPGFTEKDGVEYLLASIANDTKYEQLVNFTNSYSRKTSGGDLPSLDKLYTDICNMHSTHWENERRKKRANPTTPSNGNKKSKYEECSNCGKHHEGGIKACTKKGGGAHVAKSNGNANNNKKNNNSTGKAPYKERVKCTRCGRRGHQVDTPCTATKCDICNSIYHEQGHYPCAMAKKPKGNNNAQNNSTVKVTSFKSSKWGQGYAKRVLCQKVDEPVDFCNQDMTYPTDDEIDDEDRGPGHRRKS